jgi:type IV pilus assembly protein PilY1
LLATLTDASGVAQPVTTAPLIEIHPVTRQRYVLVGTGQLLAATDIINTQMQSFYAILDGTAAGFSTVTTPITRANLTQLTTSNLTQINTLPTASKGWFTDLGLDPASGIGWRVILNPQAFNGIVAIATSLTSSNDPCSPQGSSRVYALDFSTGTSVLQPSSLPYVNYAAAAINLRFTGANGSPELIVGFTAGSPQKVPASLTGTLATRILNWREVPTVE